jgi:hypothetical protein
MLFYYGLEVIRNYKTHKSKYMTFMLNYINNINELTLNLNEQNKIKLKIKPFTPVKYLYTDKLLVKQLNNENLNILIEK